MATDSTTDGRRMRGRSTRRALVDAAVDTVLDRGFAALTLREVAGRAGVSAAATTYHFGTVDALLDAVLDELATRATRRLADLTRRSREGELSLLDACTTYVVDLLGPDRRTLLAQLEIRLSAARSPDTGRLPDGHEERVVDLIAAYTGDREQARDLFTAVFGFAALGVLSHPPDAAAVREHLQRLLARHGLLEDTRAPASTS
ncbi:TetR/AcrR family transcriptional regulator [Pseudonocardia sp. CA-107938]|uniref:TetR/AcrR family transcriptional regulator n=1 Tax=Pseudonocardia sp. CA-107938 TaxID=3240021 RepID=UPI003D91E4FC